MLENPRVTKTKFPANESRLHGAIVISRCLVKGRIGATIGLVYEDEEGERFTAYTFNDRMIVISEEPDVQDDAKQQAEKEKADAEKKRQGGKSDDKKA